MSRLGSPWPAVLAFALGLCAPGVVGARDARLPSVMVWAWESPQDLKFLEGRGVGIAYLALTLTLEGEAVRVRPRLQPMRLPRNTPLVPVARIEIARVTRAGATPGRAVERSAALSERQRHDLVAHVLALARAPGTRALQIDFDAPVSARPFYRALLADTRAALPDSVVLSITALASWCLGDAWVSDLPVDEVVPMLFRMGTDDREVRRRLGDSMDARTASAMSCAACATSVGLATDEPPIWPGGRVRRVYLFHAGPWNRADFDAARARLEGRISDGT